jgi:hypothetical protein
MKLPTLAATAAIVVFYQSIGFAAVSPDPKQYARQRGWELYNPAHTAQAPSPDIAPVLYYEDEDSVPSCGLISVVPGTEATRFTELMHAPKGEEFPQCVNVVAFVPFKLDAKDYLSVEYLVRDTRDDLYRKFIYMRRDPKQGYILDATGPKPSTIKAKNIAAMASSASSILDGLKNARAAYLTQAYPQWQFQERDFISDKRSSFSVFHDSKTQQCQIVTEAGDKPVVASQADFVAGSQCAAVLASSRLEKSGTTYYVALFKLANANRLAAITSVSPAGAIRVEKELAERINRTNATKNMKTAKTELEQVLQH